MMRLILFTAAVAIAAPAGAQQAPVTGLNVRTAIHAQGSYRQGDGRNWGEYNLKGQKAFSFVEEARDEWSVYLFDPARNVRVQIDLYRKKVRYAENGAPYADLYDVTGATAGIAPRPSMSVPSIRADETPLANPSWNNAPPTYGIGRGGDSYGVEAGTLRTQPDANARCPALAQEVGGSWTGQWRSGAPGYPGICRIRFRR